MTPKQGPRDAPETPHAAVASNAGAHALAGTSGALVILSANPIHDTGGGQRSAQLALEFLERAWAVLFVSHGQVTETVDLGLSYPHPRLVRASLTEVVAPSGAGIIDAFLAADEAVVVTQVPVPAWLPVLSRARRAGAVCVYDLIDEWGPELGAEWFRPRDERRVAAASQVLVATVPALRRRLLRSGRPVYTLPNAFNAHLFRADRAAPRPRDLPQGPVALYVGALWGGWMDWALVSRAARALPELSFVFVGDDRGEGRGLPDNCRFLGLKPQTSLPPYLAHAAVGMLPWRSDHVTQASSPLKVYEYIAMGLPVVAQALEHLREIPGLTPCADPDAFVAALDRAVNGGVSPELRASMADFAARSTWARRVDDLLELTRAARPARGGLIERLRRILGI